MDKYKITTLMACLTMPLLASANDNFTLTSPTIENNAAITAPLYWDQFGCSGDNVRPELNWDNAPKNTKSFAITFYDHDAPTGSGFWHWLAYDIDPTVNDIKTDKLPVGTVEGNTDIGKPGFFGPCPPVGSKHAYTFTLHALDIEKLPAPKGSTAALTGFYIHQHTIDKATLTVTAGPRK